MRIGAWEYFPATATIARGAVRRRLEHRTAKVLDVLIEAKGDPVSTARLIDLVWAGRSLSSNSVSVVIADLRRAFDDNSRSPEYIETIPKTGYRLLPAPALPRPTQSPTATEARGRSRAMIGIAALLVLATIAALTIQFLSRPGPVALTVEPIVNDTGNAKYQPLTSAVTELVTTHAAAMNGVSVATRPDDARWRIYGKLVLWNGQESVSLNLADRDSGTILASAMAAGPASQLPRQIDIGFDHFQKYVDAEAAPGSIVGRGQTSR